MPVITGAVSYPADIPATLRALGLSVIAVDALTHAEALGNAKATNVVMLGVLAPLLPEFSYDDWMAAIRANVKPAFVELNVKAFETGQACC